MAYTDEIRTSASIKLKKQAGLHVLPGLHSSVPTHFKAFKIFFFLNQPGSQRNTKKKNPQRLHF